MDGLKQHVPPKMSYWCIILYLFLLKDYLEKNFQSFDFYSTAKKEDNVFGVYVCSYVSM